MDWTSWFLLYLLIGALITMLGYKNGQTKMASLKWDLFGILIWPLIFFAVFFGRAYQDLNKK